MKTYTIQNDNGIKINVINFGGRVVNLLVPDSNNIFKDIVLGYDIPESYFKSNEKYYGSLVGRYANRIANGQFELNDKCYNLTKNEGSNTLHGGAFGFHNVFWDIQEINSNVLKLTYLSADLEDGFPGNLNVKVFYKITNDNEFIIDYYATSDSATMVSFTHHSFFNLTGDFKRLILDHILEIAADYFTPVNEDLIPTGEIRNVKNTVFNFKSPKRIGDKIDNLDDQLRIGKGYDHNWILNQNGDSDEIKLAARISEPSNGRIMEVFTNEPCIQFYSGNYLDGSDNGKGNIPYNHRSAFCLETQKFPDGPNQENFPTPVLNPDETYYSTCIYKFKKA